MKLGILQKLEIAKQLNQQVKWDWRFGVGKGNDKENYILEYTSQPIKSDIFVNLVKFVSKEAYRFPLDELEDGKELELPKDAYVGQEEKLLTIFPKVQPKGETLLSKFLKFFSVTKTKKGLILKGRVGGLRKC